MFLINIAQTPGLFSKFFNVNDADAVLSAISRFEPTRVIFIDTPATPVMRSLVEALLGRGIMVIVRDHHGVVNPRNPREVEIAESAGKVRELLGANALISNRAAHPACSTLVQVGEFVGEGTVIVADPDPDGLTASMKALGVVYDQLDADAAILDGARSEQNAEHLSPLAMLLVKGMATLPPYDAARPQFSDDAKSRLFSEFVAAAGGDAKALAGLETKVTAYEAAVKAAEEVAAAAKELVPGVVVADIVGRKVDLSTLTARLEAVPGCAITVIRKDNGPIAGALKVKQYSLAVVKAMQAEINLQDLLPQGYKSSPEAGIISNTSFLLHVSEGNWFDLVLPALAAKYC
jgi:hypothetical protein